MQPEKFQIQRLHFFNDALSFIDSNMIFSNASSQSTIPFAVINKKGMYNRGSSVARDASSGTRVIAQDVVLLGRHEKKCMLPQTTRPAPHLKKSKKPFFSKMASTSTSSTLTLDSIVTLLVEHEVNSSRPIRLAESKPVFDYRILIEPSNTHIVVDKPYQSGGSNAILSAVLRGVHHYASTEEDVLVFIVTDKRATAFDARSKLESDLASLSFPPEICKPFLHPIDLPSNIAHFFQTILYNDADVNVLFGQGDVHGLGRLYQVAASNRAIETPAHVISIVDECDAHVRSSGINHQSSKRVKFDDERQLEEILFRKLIPISDVTVAISATPMAYTDRCTQHGTPFVETYGCPDSAFYHGLNDVQLLNGLVLPPAITVANLEKEMASPNSVTKHVIHTFWKAFDGADQGLLLDLTCINTSAAYNQYQHAQRIADFMVHKPAVIILNGDGLRLYKPNVPITKETGVTKYNRISAAIEAVEQISHLVGVSHVCGERGQSWVSTKRVPTHGIVYPGHRDSSQLGQAMARLCFTRKHLLSSGTVFCLSTQQDYDERMMVADGRRDTERDIYRAKRLAQLREMDTGLNSIGISADFEDSLSAMENFFFQRVFVSSSQHFKCLHALILRTIVTVTMDPVPMKKLQKIIRQIPGWFSEQREKNIPKYAFTRFSPSARPNDGKEQVVYQVLMNKSYQSDYWSIEVDASGFPVLRLNDAMKSLAQKLEPYGGLQHILQKSLQISAVDSSSDATS